MKIIKTSLEGLFLIKNNFYEDERGYFVESFRSSFLDQNFPNIKFVQENESKSKYGVMRGLHFQKEPFQQTKLVRVIVGSVLDVVVDLRKKSPTYGKVESFLIDDKNKLQLLIPRGFAHGFIVTSDEAIFSYKVDNYYAPSHEDGISFLNSDLGININDYIRVKPVISTKDSKYLKLKDYLKINL